MHKLLIIEDEDHLRDLIMSEVDWTKLGFEAEQAENGKDALLVAQDFIPDALLTDIRMPFIDGLELIQILKKQYPELLAIVLSGHDEFDYAKESLKMGVTDYLLKPIKPSMLVDVMRSLKKDLDRREEEKTENEKIRLKLDESMPYLRQQYLLLILTEMFSDEMIKEQFDYLGIELAGSSYTLSVLTYGLNGESSDRFFTFYAVQNIMEECFSENAISFFDNNGTHFVLFATQENQDDRPQIQSNLEACIASIYERMGLVATAAIGHEVNRLSALKQSYISALAALDNQVLHSRGKVYDAIQYGAIATNKLDFSYQEAEDLLEKMPYMDPKALHHKLKMFFTKFTRTELHRCNYVTIYIL